MPEKQQTQKTQKTKKPKQKGGSIASDSVVALVSKPAFAQLDTQFDNQVGGKKALKGGMCPMCGGKTPCGKQMQKQKGGAANSMFQVKYDYSTAMQQGTHGVPVDRAVNEVAVAMLATDNPSSLGDMSKTVQYGNIFGNSQVPFTYGGAKKKPASKKPSAKAAKPSKSKK
jgi:hypothetical protein